MKELKVAAYCRVSTDKEDQANSLEGQKKYFREYIESHKGWRLVEIFYDEGASGTQTRKRASFNRMIAAAIQGEIDLIITKEVSRFARNTVDTLSYTRILREVRVGVIFCLDHIDTRDPDGELRLSIMACIAQEESRKTSERVKWGQKRRMEQGIVFGGDLLGYRVKDGKMFVNENEAAVVRTIFHKFVNEGKGTYVIARELLQEGIRPKRGEVWSNVMILRILKNEKYVGDLCQKKTYTPDYLTHDKKYNHGEEARIYLEHHHKPIIDSEIWRRAQEELKRRAPLEDQKSRYSNRYWCSGKLVCGECGEHYVSRTKTLKNGVQYQGWRCYAFARHGQSKLDAEGKMIGCCNGSINERSLTACMNNCMAHIQIDREALKKDMLQELMNLGKITRGRQDAERIHKQVNAVRQKKKKAIDLTLEGIITEKDLQTQNAWYDQEIHGLEKQLLGLDEGQRDYDWQAEDMRRYKDAVDKILNFRESEKKEMLFREVLDQIVLLQNQTVTVWLKCIPFGIQLRISTHGRGENFTTDIKWLGCIEK